MDLGTALIIIGKILIIIGKKIPLPSAISQVASEYDLSESEVWEIWNKYH